ncbi:MAG: hypothetical protein SOR38_09120 [Oscillospiraceae bacterium]|nr:hypothetical protein [Oscillospiraceae bacterium]MDY3065944.1 hypothetical protein [Oscillospiraceae bacterium]
MTVSELMQKNTPSAAYEGWVTNDDYVLAVGIDLAESATEKDYTVVQMGIAGLDAQLNPITVDKTYIRAGQSSMKTGNQRAFKATGDRYIGDPFQDFAFSHEIKFGAGNSVVVPYVYFNVLNGKGEKGSVSIVVNSDGSGNAGESSGIDVDLKKTGAAPEEFTYTAVAGS